MLDGLVDIFLPDLKYFDSRLGEKYSVIWFFPGNGETAAAAWIGFMKLLAMMFSFQS